MSDYETDTTEDLQANEAEETAEQTADCAPAKPRWRRILKWTAIGIGGTLLTVAFAGFMLYNFGGMSGSVYPELGPKYEQLVIAGEVAPIQKRFVIPIPGCKCHSKDPWLTAQHSRRRINECGKCHNTNPAHMEPGIL